MIKHLLLLLSLFALPLAVTRQPAGLPPLTNVLYSGESPFIEYTPPGNPAYTFNWTGACIPFPGDPTRPDCTINWGYNNGAGGALPNGEPAFYIQLESHYAPNSTTRQFEYHWNAFPSAAAAYRPMQLNVDKNSGASSLYWQVDRTEFRTRNMALMAMADNQIRVYQPLYIENGVMTKQIVNGRMVFGFRATHDQMGFYGAPLQGKPTCATPEECMSKLEALGLINYTGND